MHGRNWGKKWTDPSMSAKRKWRTYCRLSKGRKWRWGKDVEQEKVSTSNWTIHILWQCLYFIVTWYNCILHAVRHTHYTWVEYNRVNEGLSTYFNENTFCPLIFTNIYFFLKPRLHVMTWPYKISLLTPWCRVLLEKLTGLQLVKKFPAFHGTRRFINSLTASATCLYPGPAQSSPYTPIPPPGDPS